MRVILSISSDIGTALALDWLAAKHHVIGTYRSWSKNCELLSASGAELIRCDLTEPKSVSAATARIQSLSPWEILVIATGDQQPVGAFQDVNFLEWDSSIQVNFLRPLEFVHKILPSRSTKPNFTSSVIFFAGGGTNCATKNYSGYTISKIGLIKMTELLDYEIQDCKFTIIGPGWIESKIHDATISAGEKAGENFEKTQKMRREKLMNPMSIVIDACNWVISKPKEIVGGRNFSAVFDDLDSKILSAELISDVNLFKLRRAGNGKHERQTSDS